jgi:hypothetical protein
MKESKEYLDYLKRAVSSFPALTTFLIRHHKEQIMTDLQKLQFSFTDLPQEVRLSLLPLLPPDMIRDTIHEISMEEQNQWCQEQIDFQDLHGTTEEVLKEIKKDNLDNATEADLSNITSALQEFLKQIPLKTISVLAESNPELISAYLFKMDESQLSVTVPLMKVDSFLSYMEKQPFPIQIDYLSFATNEQKEQYLKPVSKEELGETKKPLYISTEVKKWTNNYKPQLDNLIELFNQDPSQENYDNLKKAWDDILFQPDLLLRASTFLLSHV